MFNLIACAVSKHEGRYLNDWLQWHKRLGVEKFVLYDEGGEHLTHQVLQKYCWDGLVDFIPAPQHPVQYQAYSNCINRYVGKSDWVLFLDIDEFICPTGLQNLDLRAWLNKFNHHNIGAVGMAWSCFGSNEKDVYEPIPVWERIVHRVDYEETAKHHTRHIKSFVRPQCVRSVFDPHLFSLKTGFITVDPKFRPLHTSEWKSWEFPMDEVFVAHYSTKTREEWALKFARGSADSGPDAHNARKMEMFEAHIKACTRVDHSMQLMAKRLGL